jgi:DNA invertase Pin-like site-specific DNA recombinase
MLQPRSKNGKWLSIPQRDPAIPLRAIGYVRVSTEEQSRHGLSLEAQRHQIKGHCTLHSKSPGERTLELLDILADEGKRASSLRNRPALQRIIKMAREGEIDCVVVWRMDRLFRNLQDQLDTISRWKDQGVRLISTSDMFDTSTAAGRLFMSIKGAIAQFESEQTGERVRLVKHHKLERLEYGGGGAPLGWQIAEKFGPNGKKMLEPCIGELEVLEVIERLNNQGNSINRICIELEKMRFKNRAGKYNWSTKTVWKAIRAMESGFADR